jgi:hypothetical protein
MALAMAATAAAPAAAQDVIIRQPSETRVIEREPADTEVIVREPAERRVIVREAEPEVVVRRAPDVVRKYVVEESRPSVRYERQVSVGDALPEDVDAYSVPDSEYRYVVLNQRRYIVNRERRIIDVVD